MDTVLQEKDMRIVVPGRKDYLKFFVPVCKQDVMLTFSRFILRRETNDGTLLCNTLTGELVLLSDEEKELFDKLPLPYGPALKTLESLIHHRFIVSLNCEEAQSVDQLRALFFFF